MSTVQCKISKDVQKMTFKGNSRGNCSEGQGGMSGSSPLRLEGSCDSRVGRLDRVSGVEKQPRGAIKLKSTQTR